MIRSTLENAKHEVNKHKCTCGTLLETFPEQLSWIDGTGQKQGDTEDMLA